MNEVNVTSTHAIILTLEIKNPDVFKEALAFIGKGLKIYRHGSPTKHRGIISYYADDLRDALSTDMYDLSKEAAKAFGVLQDSYEYYDADRIMLVGPEEPNE